LPKGIPWCLSLGMNSMIRSCQHSSKITNSGGLHKLVSFYGEAKLNIKSNLLSETYID